MKKSKPERCFNDPEVVKAWKQILKLERSYKTKISTRKHLKVAEQRPHEEYKSIGRVEFVFKTNKSLEALKVVNNITKRTGAQTGKLKSRYPEERKRYTVVIEPVFP